MLLICLHREKAEGEEVEGEEAAQEEDVSIKEMTLDEYKAQMTVVSFVRATQFLCGWVGEEREMVNYRPCGY